MDSRINALLAKTERQAGLLQAVNMMSAIMLRSHAAFSDSDWVCFMGIMAKAASADRAYIWKNYTKDGQLYCAQIFEWSGNAWLRDENPFAVEMLYSDIVPSWEERLSRGYCVNGTVREMPDREKAALSEQSVQSVLVVPIFLKRRFWGFVRFDDLRMERTFSDMEEAILRTASQLIANVLLHNEESKNARQAEAQIMHILDAMPMACHLWDKNFKIISCNEAAVNLYGFSGKREYMEKWASECSPEYQPDGRRSDEKMRSLVEQAFAEGALVFDWMRQTPDGSRMPAEITLARVKYKNGYAVAGYTKDVGIIRRLEEKAEEADYDSLTGIYNRRYLDASLNRLIKTLSRSNSYLSLMMVDIDYFKQYNDVYGHDNGDDCLKIIAEILSTSLSRDTDFPARYGGEEFTVVLPNTDEKGARVIAERLLERVRGSKIQHCQSDIADHITISVGVTTGTVSHAQSGKDYIKRADEMLYASKQGGRNRYFFAYL
jgi:diguanylate cyclase (GGDEF)-like protein